MSEITVRVQGMSPSAGTPPPPTPQGAAPAPQTGGQAPLPPREGTVPPSPSAGTPPPPTPQGAAPAPQTGGQAPLPPREGTVPPSPSAGTNASSATSPLASPPTTAAGGSTASQAGISPTPRQDAGLVDELRRSIIAQGAMVVPTNQSSMRSILSVVETQQRTRINEEVGAKYRALRAPIEEEADRVAYEAAVAGKKDAEIQKLQQPYFRQLNSLDVQEEQEKQTRQDELTRALQELTDSIRQTGTLDPTSYVGQLRAARQAAIFERDTAADRDTAVAANARVQSIDKQLHEVTREGAEPEAQPTDWGARGIQAMMSAQAIMSGAQSGNLGSMITGGTNLIGQIAGLSTKSLARANAIAGALAGTWQMIQTEGENRNNYSGLTALTGGFNSRDFWTDRESIEGGMMNFSPVWGRLENGTHVDRMPTIQQLGMRGKEFAASAEQRTRQRGGMLPGESRSDILNEAFYQEALERVFSLNSGALGSAGQYDRYGASASESLAALVSDLQHIRNSGVTQGQYGRVNEILGLQQELMSAQFRYQNRPSVAAANRNVEMMARVASDTGYSFDSRSGGHANALINTVLTPGNDRMTALRNRVIEELVPEYNGQSTRGRADLAERIAQDPQYQQVVMKGMLERVEQMYGGVDTQSGYYAFKALLPGIESAEQRGDIVTSILHGAGGQGIEHGARKTTEQQNAMVAAVGENRRGDFAELAKQWTAEVTTMSRQLSDGFSSLVAGISDVIRSLFRIQGAVEDIQNHYE